MLDPMSIKIEPENETVLIMDVYGDDYDEGDVKVTQIIKTETKEEKKIPVAKKSYRRMPTKTSLRHLVYFLNSLHDSIVLFPLCKHYLIM